MAFAHGKGAQILLGDAAAAYDLSGWLQKATPTVDVDTAEATTFGNDSKAYIAGLEDAKFSMEGLYEYLEGPPESGIDTILRSVLGNDRSSANGNVVAVVSPTGGAALGDATRAIAGVNTNYEVDTPIDGIITIKAEVQGDGTRFDAGYVLLPLASRSGGTDAPSSSHDDGVGVSALTAGLVFFYVCTVHDAGGSVSLKLQTSPDNSTWADVSGSEFTIADTSAGHVQISGAADRYVRAIRTDNSATHTTFAGYARRFV